MKVSNLESGNMEESNTFMNEKALPELLNLVEANRDREDDSTGKNGGTSRGSNSTGKKRSHESRN